MGPLIEIDNLGCISKEELLKTILPKYKVSLSELGIEAPCSTGIVQQYKWRFRIDKSLEDVMRYFRDDRLMDILTEVGKPALKRFELMKDEAIEVGAKGAYWIIKPLTIARGQFIITHKSSVGGSFRIGYIRLENLRKNWQFLGMMDMSNFGFSIFEFNATEDGKALGSYYIAQQLPGHKWGRLMAEVLKKKLKNSSFDLAFIKLKKDIESSL